MRLLLEILLGFLSASDPGGFVAFPVDYPINYSIRVDEKTTILFETPLSKELPANFDAIAVQGKVSNSNISFEIWIPEFNEVEDEIVYKIVKASDFKIYTNGRFWARFDLKSSVKWFKFVVINKGVKDKRFDISIYEIHLVRFDKKKIGIETGDGEDKDLSLPDPLPFKLIRRAQWKAKPPKESYIEHIPKKITIHHTAGNYPLTDEDSFIEVQVIQEYHQQARGWIDIGYHFLIDPSGNIFEGRPILAVGAHVAKFNVDNIGIAVLGNYHPPVNNEVTEKAVSAIITLVRYLKDRYDIAKKSFYAHRELAKTTCPGDNLYAKMPFLRSRIFEEEVIPLEVDLANDELNGRIVDSIQSW